MIHLSLVPELKPVSHAPSSSLHAEKIPLFVLELTGLV